MSGQTWLKEFFPIAAEEIPNDDALMAQHALQKWTGLQQENLSEHGVYLDGQYLRELNTTIPVLKITKDTCAFCKTYWNNDCVDCPIFKKLGHTCDDGENSPYVDFLFNKNPMPMLGVLEAINQELN